MYNMSGKLACQLAHGCKMLASLWSEPSCNPGKGFDPDKAAEKLDAELRSMLAQTECKLDVNRHGIGMGNDHMSERHDL